MRKDIPENIKIIFDHRIKEVLTEASNFISDFQAITMSAMLLLKDHGFEVADNGELQFIQKSGFETKGAFPEKFKMEADIEFSANPFSSAVLTNLKTHDDVKQLFTETHINFMKSLIFGIRETIAASKSNHPVLQCLVNAFPESIKSLFQDKNSLPKSVMDIAITNFITNLTLL